MCSTFSHTDTNILTTFISVQNTGGCWTYTTLKKRERGEILWLRVRHWQKPETELGVTSLFFLLYLYLYIFLAVLDNLTERNAMAWGSQYADVLPRDEATEDAISRCLAEWNGRYPGNPAQQS